MYICIYIYICSGIGGPLDCENEHSTTSTTTTTTTTAGDNKSVVVLSLQEIMTKKGG